MTDAGAAAKPELLVVVTIPPAHLALLQESFAVHYAPQPAEREAALKAFGGQARAVLTNGSTGWSEAAMTAMPRLEIICAMGAGYENVDVAAARRRGLSLSYGSNSNDACVADHAMGLLLAVVRGIAQADLRVRRGDWPRETFQPLVSGKTLGILGLGNIGRQIARRAGGFDMKVVYHSRRPRPDVAWEYAASAVELAARSDFLILACPGGKTTYHLVDKAVLDALGPQGFVVNIARGSVVDTAALIDALENGRIAGAGLDTVEGEPVIPEKLRGLANVVLTPHIAGRSPETSRAMIELAAKNLSAHFAGQPLLTPIP